MPTPTTFEYKEAPTTLPQKKFLDTLAKHFKMPVKQFREALDMDGLHQNGIIDFNVMATPIKETFYISSFKINVADLTNPTKFQSSEFSEKYGLMRASQNMTDVGTLFVIYSSPAFYIVCALSGLDIPGSVEGVGGVYLNYPPLLIDKILLPLSSYLSIRYPSPSNE